MGQRASQQARHANHRRRDREGLAQRCRESITEYKKCQDYDIPSTSNVLFNTRLVPNRGCLACRFSTPDAYIQTTFTSQTGKEHADFCGNAIRRCARVLRLKKPLIIAKVTNYFRDRGDKGKLCFIKPPHKF